MPMTLPPRTRTVFLLPLLLLGLVHALEVTPNSACSPLCIDNIQANPNDTLPSSTQKNDLICNDWELDGPNSTVKGRKWKDCLTCEMTSKATDKASKENDVYWFLFNMKFAIDWCVFGYPDNTNITQANVKCSGTCAGTGSSAKKALTDRLLQTNATLQYQYCKEPDINNTLDDCAACLDSVPNAKALGYYAEALNAACVQQPDLGEVVSIDFDIFPPPSSPTTAAPSKETVTVTSPPLSPPSSPAAIITSSSGAAAASASAAAAAKTSHDSNVKIGVGVGVGAGGVLAILAVIAVIWMRRRSQRRKQAEVESRARWELEYQAGAMRKQDHDRQMSELGGGYGMVEADDGRPTEVPMLENREATASPGKFSSSGGSRTSSTGMSRIFGMKPAVPEKDRH